MFSITPLKAVLFSIMCFATLILDFSDKNLVQNWRVIDDVVMGGRSRSEFDITESATAVFQGTLSLENYGGFASVRGPVPEMDLKPFAGIELRVRGDGRRYQLRLRTDDRFDGVSYKYEFNTDERKWISVKAPFSEFVATFRGRIITDYPALDPSRIKQMGFLLADKKEGRFLLEIDSISAYGAEDQ